MGFSHDKIFRLILLAAVLFSAVPLSAESDGGVAATLTDFIMPHYRKNKLQFVLYGEKGINLGAMITFTNPLIDIVTSDLQDVMLVTTLKGVKCPEPGADGNAPVATDRLYPLYSSKETVAEFWERIPHSQAVIAAENAQYDKNKRLLSGDGPVHFRSRDLDIDGMGFDADQKKKFVHIRSEVKVVLHPYGKELSSRADQLLEQKMEALNKNITVKPKKEKP